MGRRKLPPLSTEEVLDQGRADAAKELALLYRGALRTAPFPRAEVVIVDDPIGEPGFPASEVHEVEDSRALMTIGPGAAVWGQPELIGSWGAAVRGAIVRLDPPDDAHDRAVKKVEEELYEAGAAVVRVLPRRTVSATPAARGPTEHKTARAVVGEMVDESSVEIRDALRAFCEGIMARRKLG